MKICEECVLWELEQARDHFGELAEKILQARKDIRDTDTLFRILDEYMYLSDDGVISMHDVEAADDPEAYDFLKRVVFLMEDDEDENV